VNGEVKGGGPAFPIYDHHADGQQFLAETGMTLRQYAAIKLRVPDSGTDWLDKMIVKAKRDEIAAMAMQAYFTDPNVGFGSDVIDAGTQSACRISAALLKARGYA